MTAISKTIFLIYILNDTVNKYNNTYHRAIKMKPIDVEDGSFAEYNK